MTAKRSFVLALAMMLALLAWCGAAAAHAGTDPHYTDGTQCAGGQFCGLPSNPPPTNPFFGEACKTDIVDPPGFVYMTEHFVYGTVAPAAGVVPVADDASITVPYKGVAPGTFSIDVEALVAGRRGFRADTWNIGKGVTAWMPFDCTVPETTTTTTPRSQCEIPEGCDTTTTTAAPVTTTTMIETGGTPPLTLTAAPAPAPVAAQPQMTG